MKYPNLKTLEEEVKKVSLEEMKYYLLTYPVFVEFFKNKNHLANNDVLVGYGFTYSWMPTIPKRVNKNLINDSTKILNEAKLSRKLLIGQFEVLKNTFNNSIVGVSKLLHFINPERFAIWDSNVAKAVEFANHKVNTVKAYRDYNAGCAEFLTNNNFDSIWSCVNKKLSTNVSALRALEILLFSIGKA